MTNKYDRWADSEKDRHRQTQTNPYSDIEGITGGGEGPPSLLENKNLIRGPSI